MTRCGIGLDGSGQGWSIEGLSSHGPGSMAAVFFQKISRFALLICWLLSVTALLPLGTALAVDARSQSASLSLTEKGIAAAQAGDLAAARRLLEEAVVSNPANARAYTELAAVQNAAGNRKLARKYYVIALAIDPVFPAALAGLARLNIMAGDEDAAKLLLGKLRLSCPACTETREIERALDAGSSPSPEVKPNP
jgi:Tfp pilus assembly protein PilF